MAKALNVLVLIFCMTHSTNAMSDRQKEQLKHFTSHIMGAQLYFGEILKQLPKDFPWLGKSKAAKYMVAESISTMSEACFESCSFGKNYHRTMCAIDGDEVFPLIYGPLMEKDASDKGLCDKVDDNQDQFVKLCLKHCRTNTLTSMLILSQEAQRMIDGDGSDSMKSEESEEKSKISDFPDTSRLYEVTEETVDFSELMDKSDDNSKVQVVPTWAMAVMLTSFASMIGMGKAIYGLNKRLAVAEAPHPESAKCDPYNQLSEFE
jgi:hypothetical protein